jgi:hypothetical protein
MQVDEREKPLLPWSVLLALTIQLGLVQTYIRRFCTHARAFAACPAPAVPAIPRW